MILQKFPIKLIEECYDSNRYEDSLDDPCFHDDGCFFDSIMFEEMMQRRDDKEFSLEIFFSEDLQKA